MKIEHGIYIETEVADISALIKLPAEELQAMRDRSAEAEQMIFDGLCESAKSWEVQAAKSALLDKAMEYVRTPAIEHSSNQWVQDKYDNQSISNMVYQMRYSIYEETKYNRDTERSEPVAWQLYWSVSTNEPKAPSSYYGSSGYKIAGQDRKKFTEKAAMEKYLQGRIKAYSSYFTEISPPVPQELANRFKVNGQLLPGYTIEGQEPERAAAGAKNNIDPASPAESKKSVRDQLAAFQANTAPNAGERAKHQQERQ